MQGSPCIQSQRYCDSQCQACLKLFHDHILRNQLRRLRWGGRALSKSQIILVLPFFPFILAREMLVRFIGSTWQALQEWRARMKGKTGQKKHAGAWLMLLARQSTGNNLDPNIQGNLFAEGKAPINQIQYWCNTSNHGCRAGVPTTSRHAITHEACVHSSSEVWIASSISRLHHTLHLCRKAIYLGVWRIRAHKCDVYIKT